jgi:NADH-quinone oxidoreductase subunit G
MQAAEKLGIFIPRYCYHPGLSIAGNCRICLVEVEKFPKLQIACNTPVAEGMVVRTRSPQVAQAQQAVLEFLLVNHPLDCPVCDQAGECDLQNFYLQYGRYDPRFREQKVKKPKAVPLGPHVMLDAERCILCSRCVRFTDEITQTGEFGIFNRGNRAVVGLYPGKVLDNPYSGNVVDICPVGALTDRDFRFKARVWYLSQSPSVCAGCAQGCNIEVHYVLNRPHLADGARVMRLKPRYNESVNRWWMCDEGRYGYGFVDRDRLRKVIHCGVERSWEYALSELAQRLKRFQMEGRFKEVAVLASPQLTCEDIFVIRKWWGEMLHVGYLPTRIPFPLGSSDRFLIRADKNPNTAGMELILAHPPDSGQPAPIASFEATIQAALSGTIALLWVFGIDLVKLLGEATMERLAKQVPELVFQGSNTNGTVRFAHWVLPSAVYLEKDGTFVNCQGRVQRIGKVLPPLPEARADWQILLDLARRLGATWSWHSAEEIFHALSREIPAFCGLSYADLGWEGKVLPDFQSKGRLP